MYVTRLL